VCRAHALSAGQFWYSLTLPDPKDRVTIDPPHRDAVTGISRLSPAQSGGVRLGRGCAAQISLSSGSWLPDAGNVWRNKDIESDLHDPNIILILLMQNNKKLMGEMDRTRVCQVLRQLFSEAETCRL